MAACRAGTIMFFRLVCCSAPKPTSRSRIFTRGWLDLYGSERPQGTTVTDQIDYIATLRGRFGYAFDHWLIYGTGGFAWSQARFGETPGVASDEDKILLTRTGWTLGLGAEVAIAPDWTARIEYLYDDFGTVAGVFPSGTGYQSVFDINTLRLGLDYKLGSADARDGGWRAIRGRSHPIAGMSTANSPPSSRAIRPSVRPTKVRTAYPAPTRPRIR